MSGGDRTVGQDIRSHAAGYGLALLLTCLAFAVVKWHLTAARDTMAVVLGLGIVQMLVHFRSFLHVDFRRSSRDDLQLILFTVVIIALMAGGTLVILLNLRHRMM